MSDIFVSRDRWICENRVSLGVKEISGAETQILSVRFPFCIGLALHIQRAVSKSTKCSKFVGRSGPEVATGIVEVVQALCSLFSRGQQLTGGTHADKLVEGGDRNRRSEKRCRLRATCSPLPPTR